MLGKKKSRNWLIAGGVTTVLLLLVAGSGIGAHYYYQGKTLPNQTFAGINVGGMRQGLAETLIKQRWETLQTLELEFEYNGTQSELSVDDLGIKWGSLDKSMEKLTVYTTDMSWWRLVTDGLQTKSVPLYFRTDQMSAEEAIYTAFEDLERYSNAYFDKNEEGSILVKPGQTGEAIIWDDLHDKLLQRVVMKKPSTIAVATQVSVPTITESELLEVQDSFLALTEQPLTLKSDSDNWTIDWREKIDMVRFDQTNDVDDASFPYELSVDGSRWNAYVDEAMSESLEWDPKNIELSLAGERVEFSGQAKEGQEIAREKLIAQINDVLNDAEAERSLKVPVDMIKGEILVDKKLEALGVVDLLAAGHTSYYGSSTNRMHNIAVGLEKFNGVVIKPGETFSFNTELGEVDGSTGYRRELVIKPEGTIPEYGGGLCQVSTTMYRTVLNADLPILERNPHSYAVSYYSQVMGHGLDATIYPGASDLKFTNDTPAAIVVQSFAIGADAYFKFYGSPLGKNIEYDGPYIGRHVGAPAPVYFHDDSLPVGYKKQVEKPHAGFDVTWYKTVTYEDGTVEKKEIFSRYKAIPAKYKVGPELTPTLAEDGTLQLEPVDG